MKTTYLACILVILFSSLKLCNYTNDSYLTLKESNPPSTTPLDKEFLPLLQPCGETRLFTGQDTHRTWSLRDLIGHLSFLTWASRSDQPILDTREVHGK